MNKTDWSAESLWFSEMQDMMEDLEEFVHFFESGSGDTGYIIMGAGDDTNSVRIPSDSPEYKTIMELLEAHYKILKGELKEAAMDDG